VSTGAELAPEVVDELREWLARSPGDLTPHRVAQGLRAAGRLVGDATVLSVYELLRRDVVGAGPLEPLLRLPGVTDVLVNGPDQVFVDRGRGLESADVRFPDDASVRRLAQRLAAAAGRRLDDAAPFADLRLGDGTRFHAVLAPLARPGTAVSLRVPSRRSFSLDDLVSAGGVPAAGAALARAIVDARLAFLVSGGTSPGVEPVTLFGFHSARRYGAPRDPRCLHRLAVRTRRLSDICHLHRDAGKRCKER
jgi:pilus assembly protein CpaF